MDLPLSSFVSPSPLLTTVCVDLAVSPPVRVTLHFPELCKMLEYTCTSLSGGWCLVVLLDYSIVCLRVTRVSDIVALV